MRINNNACPVFCLLNRLFFAPYAPASLVAALRAMIHSGVPTFRRLTTSLEHTTPALLFCSRPMVAVGQMCFQEPASPEFKYILLYLDALPVR